MVSLIQVFTPFATLVIGLAGGYLFKKEKIVEVKVPVIQAPKTVHVFHNGSAFCGVCKKHVARYYTTQDGSHVCANCDSDGFEKIINNG